MKKIFVGIFVLAAILFTDNMQVDAATTIGPTMGSGFGNNDTGNGVNCDDGGCIKGYGVRVTIVDVDGNQVSNNIVDYWTEVPDSSYEVLETATHRTEYINNDSLTQNILSLRNTKKYSSSGIVSTNNGNIGVVEPSAWPDKHEYLQSIIAEAYAGDSSYYCSKFGFLADLDYSVCDENGIIKCENADYITIEPLFKIKLYGHYLVVSGTEYAALVQYFTSIGYKVHVKNLSGSKGYGLAIAGMYLSKLDNLDWKTYKLNSNGKIYSYMPSELEQYRHKTNSTTDGTKSYTNAGYPQFDDSRAYKKTHSNSMQIIWLKPEKCETPECCVPDPNDPDKCCEEELIEVDGVCVSWEEYWTTELYDLYCTLPKPTPTPGKCNLDLPDPDVELAVCDSSNKTESVFMDPLYAVDDDEIGGENRELPDNIASVIASGTGFKSIYFDQTTDKDLYTENIGTYCDKYCQEEVRIVLPDNYPYVQAGRYFFWDIKDSTDNENSEHYIVQMKGERICAYDIKLDEWYKNYEGIALGCQSAGNFLASCGAEGNVGDWLLGSSNNCTAYTYQALMTCKSGGTVYSPYMNAATDQLNSSGYQKQAKKNAQNQLAAKYGENGTAGPTDSAKYDYWLNHPESYNSKCNSGEWVGCPDFDEEQKKAEEDDVNKMALKIAYQMCVANPPAEGCDALKGTADVTVPDCRDEETAHASAKLYTEKYAACIGVEPIFSKVGVLEGINWDIDGITEDNPYGKIIPSLVESVNSLKACFADYEAIEESNSDSSEFVLDDYLLDLEYGYETAIDGNMYYTPDDFFVDDDSQLKLLDSTCSSYFTACEEEESVFTSSKITLFGYKYDEKIGPPPFCSVYGPIKVFGEKNGDSYTYEGLLRDKLYMLPTCTPYANEVDDGTAGGGGNGNFTTQDHTPDRDINTIFDKTAVKNWMYEDISGREHEKIQDIITNLGGNNDAYNEAGGNNSNLGNGSTSSYEYGCEWKFDKFEDLSKYWKTIYVTKQNYEINYTLNDDINACVCKDGVIVDLSDGECDCLQVSDYNVIADESTENYCYYEWESTTSYVNLVDYGDGGNFSVEFMNPSGWYPLYLSYGNIGYQGKFSDYLMSEPYYMNLCPGGVCIYSDDKTEEYCKFYIDNEILLDGGKIEDSKCPDGDCGDDDGGDDVCPDGDCDNIDPDYCLEHDCSYPDGAAINGMELVYRVIDLDIPFPGSSATDETSSRKPGSNWNSADVDLVSKYILNNRGVSGNKLYSSGLEPLYSFTINPAVIKDIRKFNALNPDYASIGSMIYNDGTITGGVSYVLRGDLKNMVLSNGGSFTINLHGDERFDGISDDSVVINNNSIIDNNGNLATCSLGGE